MEVTESSVGQRTQCEYGNYGMKLSECVTLTKLSTTF